MPEYTTSLEPMCIVTRLSFPRQRDARRAKRKFDKLRKLAIRRVPGFVDAVAHLTRTGEVLFLSVWKTERSVFEFTSLDQHVEAVRWAISAHAVVWSGAFDLRGTSSMSTEWISSPAKWFDLSETPDQSEVSP
jgi:heme-degrading monooxygenase HmoA